ncbi:hypothetical protein K0B96_12455 [Horticoccus luteus]|uniref:histidine kinase n=1 Tax=Horticoccus luteus TaxID=2862869 RepID=A0A8F9TU37_9BACT|nr:sensor histidine kinase [Horticoccus luteus]QYM78117.1 hypothetical protein K0B96_12455 [Horticoccus luteus]
MAHRLSQFLFHSLRGRLALLVVAVILPVLLLAATLLAESYRRERDALTRQTELLTRMRRLVVDGVLREKEALLKGLATSAKLESGDFRGFYEQARQVTTSRDEWVVLIGADRQQIINTALPFGAPLPMIHFRDSFRQAALAGQTYVSNLIQGPATGEWLVFVAIPIQREGELRYTLNLAMRPAVLSKLLLGPNIGPGWTVSIVDGDARVVARNRGGEQYIGRQASADMMAAMHASEEGSIETVTLDGIPTISAFSRSRDTPWSVIIGAPRADLYASAHEWVVWVLGAAAVLGALTVAMAWWVSRGVWRGVQSLVADAGALVRTEPLGAAKTGMRETDVVATVLRQSADKLRARELELRLLNESLEARVQKRTKALAEANRDLDDFARIASHDLNEPLRLISSFASLLRAEHSEQLDPAGRTFVERIEASVERLRSLVRDIFTYSRTSALAPKRARVDLNATLGTVLEELAVRMEETGGRVEAEALPVVMGDPTQLHQLLANLVGNALKFRRPDVPSVVKVRAECAPGKVVLIVEDNGIGFDERYAERIFAPFERLHGYNRYDGTGIGLAIVRRIAERHGGSVRATSTPGQGSRFAVTLPVRDEPEAPRK